MDQNIENKCDLHSDRFDCPDALVNYADKFDAYGLIIHDGGRSVIGINFCPWCGKKLRDLSEEYFDEVDRLGLEPSLELPSEFNSGEWWKQRGL
jgi:hypothetical protein